MPTIALPRDVAAAVVVAGMSSAMRAVAIAGMILTALLTADVVVAAGGTFALVAIAAAPPAVVLLLAALLMMFPLPETAALYLVGGAVAAASSVVVLHTVAGAGDDPFFLNRVATALPLVGALSGSARSGVRWTLVSVPVAYLALHTGWWAVGMAGPVGYGPLLVGIIALSGFTVLAAVRHRAKKRVPEFAAAERAVLIDERERELQRRAAAAVHDTVLADLAAVSMTLGPIDDRMRSHILTDLDAITRPTQRRVDSVAQADAASTPFADALLAVADGYRWNGVSVQVSGAEELEADVPDDVIAAMVGATRAALDNVVAHAGTGHAELVVGQRDDAIAVLVVDAGVGFDPDTVGADRMGLRESIDGRIRSVGGSVRIWSGPEGTTVMMRVPLGGEDA